MMGKARIIRIRDRKRISKGALALCLAACLAVAAIAFLQSGYFDISYLQIEGMTETGAITREELMEYGGIEMGANIFSFSARQAEKGILGYVPEAKEARVKRTLPSTVKVAIAERTPFAAIYSNGAYYIADDAGFVMAQSSQIGPPSVITVSGLGNVEIELGTSFDYFQSAKAQTVSYVLKFATERGLEGMISEILVEDSGYYIYSNNNNYIKFFMLADFASNEGFVADYLATQARPNIMVELFEGADPIFKEVSIR
ncbi:MAG: FtsQ-type POTRA domain-containing protein [Eubacteriaceae bacterium]|jgi:cell division septal protein FtsQ|nr:FtsQ-type POTRA domain-containing protein [Eubacteriaceae bacterium]